MFNLFKKDDSGLKKPQKVDVSVKLDRSIVQLTTWQMLQIFFINKLILGKNGAEEYAKIIQENREKKHSHHTTEEHEPKDVPVYNIALILDGKVVEVLRAEERLADILLAKPDFVLFNSAETMVKIDGEYREGRFYDKSGKELTRDTTTTEAI